DLLHPVARPPSRGVDAPRAREPPRWVRGPPPSADAAPRGLAAHVAGGAPCRRRALPEDDAPERADGGRAGKTSRQASPPGLGRFDGRVLRAAGARRVGERRTAS